MRRRTAIAGLFGLVFSTLPMVTGCKGHKESDYHSLSEKIRQESVVFQDSVLSSEEYLAGLDRVVVLDSIHQFMIPERTQELLSFPCASCHSIPLEQMKNPGAGKRAHWNIALNHAGSGTMNCATCHNPDNMNELQSLTGQSIDMNHSYLLCSQCHSSQFADWKGGAHGKQLGGWAPPRTSMTCVQCHNPHAPALGVRWPARYNSRMASERE